MTLLDQYCPKEEKEEPEPVERREEQRDMVSEIETEDTDCKEPAGKPDREGREVSVSMDELVEEGREETAGLTRQEYMNSLDIKGVSSYISHFLSEEILRCPALLLEEEEYRGISDTAKILYGVLLSRLALSRKNSWIEKDTGRLYITYNLKQLVEKLGRSDRTISKAMKQLSEVGLIEKKKEDRVSRTLFM